LRDIKILSILVLLVFGSMSCFARFACKELIELEGIRCETITTVYEKEMLGIRDVPLRAEDAREVKDIKIKKDIRKDKEKDRDRKVGRRVSLVAPAPEVPQIAPVDAPLTDEEIVRRLGLDERKPVRIPPKIIRVWIAPWEDSDGDLHQPGYIYSEIMDRRGRWLFGEREAPTFQPLLTPMETPQRPPEQKR